MAVGKSKQKKMNVRVDFTPMVDMMMLLITFFMLCTSLAKPQSLQLTMPSNDKNINEQHQNESKASQSITIFVCANNKLFYGEGVPKYDDPSWLKETTWGKDGIRKELRYHKVEDGTMPVDEIMQAKTNLDRERAGNPTKWTDSIYNAKLDEIKEGWLNGKDNGDKLATLTVVIKATDGATYKNLIDILDEIQICSIGTYVIDQIKPQEQELLAKKGAK